MSETVLSSSHEQSSPPSDFSTLSARLEAAVRDQQPGGAVPERIRQLTELYELARLEEEAIQADIAANNAEQALIDTSLNKLKDEILQALISGNDTSSVNHAQAIVWNARLLELRAQHELLENDLKECEGYIAKNREAMEPLLTSGQIVNKALGHAALLDAELATLPALDDEPLAFSRQPLTPAAPEVEQALNVMEMPEGQTALKTLVDLRDFVESFPGGNGLISVPITIPAPTQKVLIEAPEEAEIIASPVQYQRRYGPIEPPSGLKTVLKKAGNNKVNDKKARA